MQLYALSTQFSMLAGRYSIARAIYCQQFNAHLESHLRRFSAAETDYHW